MLLKAHEIAERLERTSGDPDDPLEIIPQPDVRALKKSGDASVDLRLGRWFFVLRESRIAVLDILKEDAANESSPIHGRLRFVPFGSKFFLHPRKFILGSTLEWLRMPANLSAYISGKSSWGRRGLIIETAAGIHPGFSGCLTLEITNLGEIPIAIYPGFEICQIFLHEVKASRQKAKDHLIGYRRPVMVPIRPDRIARLLSKQISNTDPLP